MALVPAKVEETLNELGVDIRFMSRIIQVHHLWKDPVSGKYRLFSVKDHQGKIIEGDVFIDTTGTAGPQGMCHKYGNGCVSCILRCPAFGGRVSLSALCKVKEYGAVSVRNDVPGTLDRVFGNGFDKAADVYGSGLALGAMSGSCKLMKGSLSPQLCSLLEKKGVAVIPVPKNLRSVHLDIKACQQYALPEFAENIILLDTGHAKLMAPYFPLQTLKKFLALKMPGLKILTPEAWEIPYVLPLVFPGMIQCLFRVWKPVCAGEKSGILWDIRKLLLRELWRDIMRCGGNKISRCFPCQKKQPAVMLFPGSGSK